MSSAPGGRVARRRSRLIRWLSWLGANGAVIVLVVGGVVAYAWFTAPVDTVCKVEFEQRLAIPPLAESEVDGAGRRVFDLTAQADRSVLLPGTESDTWGFNGRVLGPTLRAERGEHVRVNVHNELDEPTTVHWHGMHLPARMDGGPHQMIDPGEDWSPTWQIDQPAATLWYHPHPHGNTRYASLQTYGGAIAEVPDDATAFSQRDTFVEFVAPAKWTTPPKTKCGSQQPGNMVPLWRHTPVAPISTPSPTKARPVSNAPTDQTSSSGCAGGCYSPGRFAADPHQGSRSASCVCPGSCEALTPIASVHRRCRRPPVTSPVYGRSHHGVRLRAAAG